MAPDPDSLKPSEFLESEWVPCPKCKGGYRIGGWPFCNGSPEDHWR